MQQDDVIWEVINHSFCSFKTTFKEAKFCRNEYNVSGACNKVSCPLANSRYATVREEKGVCYLYIKTIERAHTPAKLWEKIKLDQNFMAAIDTIDKNLEYWPGHMIHRVKQRYIKITQYLIRMRKLRKQIKRELVPIKKKTERRDAAREQKAMVAAQLTVNIKKELIERLNKDAYGNMYYFPEKIVNDVLLSEGVQDENEEAEEEMEQELDQYIEGDDEEYEEEYEDEDEAEQDLEDNGYDFDDEDDSEFDDDDDSEEEYVPKKSVDVNLVSIEQIQQSIEQIVTLTLKQKTSLSLQLFLYFMIDGLLFFSLNFVSDNNQILFNEHHDQFNTQELQRQHNNDSSSILIDIIIKYKNSNLKQSMMSIGYEISVCTPVPK
ncbi:MAK16-like protein [Heterostelium album PN500]|uniref:MAK16-like protein n=1 Tax=Heterostelium pallidum (strain ATCC 26659 / Pp 5 / PN500) TaxID=670386 RepID=D3BHV4_HETP5|nr:MAK16-like protein [Heterostelium album PN500]EFA78854.1 MAK16-like protein [Heterostelium album PN500]|eukprot:XP_020430978.1 MAK16-like protein [Heterostelium album PN500]